MALYTGNAKAYVYQKSMQSVPRYHGHIVHEAGIRLTFFVSFKAL